MGDLVRLYYIPSRLVRAYPMPGCTKHSMASWSAHGMRIPKRLFLKFLHYRKCESIVIIMHSPYLTRFNQGFYSSHCSRS